MASSEEEMFERMMRYYTLEPLASFRPKAPKKPKAEKKETFVVTPASPFRPLIEAEAARISWDADLLEAQVIIESSGQPDAFRFEPKFYLKFVKNNQTYNGWGPLAACSYGLLQVMYVSAYQVGFRGRPEELFVPATGLRWGCTYLQMLATKTADMSHAIAAYNGGLGNPQIDYMNKVLAERDAIVKLRSLKA